MTDVLLSNRVQIGSAILGRIRSKNRDIYSYWNIFFFFNNSDKTVFGLHLQNVLCWMGEPLWSTWVPPPWRVAHLPGQIQSRAPRPWRRCSQLAACRTRRDACGCSFWCSADVWQHNKMVTVWGWSFFVINWLEHIPDNEASNHGWLKQKKNTIHLLSGDQTLHTRFNWSIPFRECWLVSVLFWVQKWLRRGAAHPRIWRKRKYKTSSILTWKYI